MTEKRPDHDVHRDVLDSLEADPSVDAGDIGVQVGHGIVTLTGTLGDYGCQRAAVQAAWRTRGVTDVANAIVVRTAGTGVPTATEIARSVRRALEWDARVPHDRLHASIENGVVIVTGEVDSVEQHDEVTRVIARLPGVFNVANRAYVKGTPDADFTITAPAA